MSPCLARAEAALPDRVQHALSLQPVLEGRMEGRPLWRPSFPGTGRSPSLKVIDHRVNEIGNGVNEGMLVTDDVTGRPPLVDVGMSWFGCEDVAEAFSILWIARAVKFQAIHFFKIEK